MLQLTQPKDNAVTATYQYLKFIGAKVTEETVEETLKNHPDYPSLLATSDALNSWQIENVAAKLTVEQLSEIESPFLTYLKTNGGMFALVKAIKGDKIEWLHTREGLKKEKIEDFSNKWSGIVMIAETKENSGEKNYVEKRKKEIISNLRLPIIIVGIIILSAGIFYYNFSTSWQYNALLFTKLIGILITSILLWQSIDKNNLLVKKICQFGAKTNCNSILSSNAAQLTSWLSWSEVGFFYFFGGFLSILLFPDAIPTLRTFGTIALLYTFWSIYYQGLVMKQWCVLCLSIQGLLWLEFLINSTIVFSLSGWKEMIIGFTPAILFWIIIKPVLQKSQQTEHLKNALRRFKSNADLFYSFLHKQEEMPFVTRNMNTVILGKANAKHTLTIVTNPFCQPCAKTHKTIDILLENNDYLNCQVIFAASNAKGDQRGVIARNILSVDKELQAEVLSAWYLNEEKSIEKWQKQFNIIENKNTEKILELHMDWCKLGQVYGTPTLYLDGFRLPDLYNLEDLEWIVRRPVFENIDI